jgi:uncharacterized protein (DUF2147 family)
MKNPGLFISLFLISCCGLHAQVTGFWKVTDEKDGVVKSIMEVYEQDGKYHARVHRLLPTSKRTHCEKCTGKLKDKPLTGMIIIDNLTIGDQEGTDGTVLNPATGKSYSCYIQLVEPNKLKLRGYVFGMPVLGKTMYWLRE